MRARRGYKVSHPSCVLDVGSVENDRRDVTRNVTIFARQYQCLRAPILSVPATQRRGDGGGGGGSEGGGSEGGGGEVGGSGGSSGGEDAAACQTCVQGTPRAE